MMKFYIFIIFFFTLSFSFAQKDSTTNNQNEYSWKFEKERLTFGGGVGGGISNGITTVNISPIVAYIFTDKFIAGPRLIYNYYSVIYRNSWSNYGYSLLGRYFVKENIFAQAEYEEVYYASFGDNRLKIPAFLVGVGYYSSPMVLTATYDLLWDPNRTAYASPLRVSFGVMF